MHAPAIDAIAKDMAVTRFALPPCLHVPVAATDEPSIEQYVGRVARSLCRGSRKALLVESYDPEPPNPRLPIWSLDRSRIFHEPLQVWVHAAYTGYRAAYSRAFPEDDLSQTVIDHVLNRRVTQLKGFTYVRIVPISRAANSSSGGTSERWARDHHSLPSMVDVNRRSKAAIQYADLADLVKMLDLKTGGSFQEGVNEAQSLVREPRSQRG